MFKLTTATDICNAGANITEIIFDSFMELQDYMIDVSSAMDDEEAELYMYNSKIEEIEQ
jgi:hypothetical protein